MSLLAGNNIMNASVGSALSQGFGDMETTTLSMFNQIIPYALAVLITITVVIWAVGKFKELAGMSGHTNITHLREYIQKNDPEFWQEIVDDVESYDEDD